jgi:hypothetical protein
MQLLVGIAWICLICVRASEHAGVASILEKTESAVKQLEDHCKSATALAANKTAIMAFENQLQVAAAQAESTLKSRRVKLADKFHATQKKAQAAIQYANSFNVDVILDDQVASITAALDAADAALAALHNVSSELQALDREQRYQVSRALHAVREEATGFAHRLARRAERVADMVVDPLYNLGDTMEGIADKLSDKRTGLADCALDALDEVDTQFQDRAEEIEHKRNESLQLDADERLDVEMKLRRQVQRAVTRSAALEAMFLTTAQNQDYGTLFGSILLTAIAAFVCTAFARRRV